MTNEGIAFCYATTIAILQVAPIAPTVESARWGEIEFLHFSIVQVTIKYLNVESVTIGSFAILTRQYIQPSEKWPLAIDGFSRLRHSFDEERN